MLAKSIRIYRDVVVSKSLDLKWRASIGKIKVEAPSFNRAKELIDNIKLFKGSISTNEGQSHYCDYRR